MYGEPSGTLVEDIVLDLGLMMEHSEECYETFGRLECICAVGHAQRIVKSFADDRRNGTVQVE